MMDSSTDKDFKEFHREHLWTFIEFHNQVTQKCLLSGEGLVYELWNLHSAQNLMDHQYLDELLIELSSYVDIMCFSNGRGFNHT